MAPTKRAKEKKSDFQKKKLKVGSKTPAANATSTAFKARAIGLPNQHLGNAVGSGPTTKRGQTLDTLLVQLNHYSPHTRRDALAGVQELTTAHPALTAEHFGAILKACARLIADDDATVRKALISYMNWLLPSVSSDQRSPFLPLLLLSTTSALTHIFPEVRLDGIKVLDILLGVCPQAVTEGWSASSSSSDSQTHGQRILEAYLSILHVRNGQGAASTTPAARLVALRSVGNFLRAALFAQSASTEQDVLPTWFFASSFSSTRDSEAFLASMQPQSAPARAWDADPSFIERCDLCDAEATGVSSFDLQSAVNELTRPSTSSDSSQATRSLLVALQPMLTATFLEAAPTAFAPSSSSSGPHLEIAACASRTARDLWRACMAEGAKVARAEVKALRTLIDKMGAYFPFASDDHILMRRDAETRSHLEDLDLVYCELVSLLAMASEGQGKASAGSATVNAHILGLLEKQGGVPLTSSSYTALAPSLWALLRHKETSEHAFGAIIEHFAQAGSGSGMKRVALQFIEHVIELARTTRSLTLPEEAMAAFYAALPRMLWDLQAKDTLTSTRILAVLHRAVIQENLEMATLDRLCPFFSMQHKERGLVKGPYIRLPSRAQAFARAIVDYAAYGALTSALEAVETPA